ncbi:hypothetical protein D5S17_10400 [Pseudonocardiaceae bacterium YIM PH 21723]|nr:hypothetical protein D5S17_10400 [Pseudonocardiaceae bacterium YIM PH 21723]
MNVTVEIDRDPQVEDRLIGELFAAIDEQWSPEGEIEDRPVVATAIARQDGALLGWAELLFPVEDEPNPILQWILTSREVERLRTGRALGEPGTEAEIATLSALIKAAAEHAKAEGHQAVTWADTEVDLDAKVADAIGALVHEEIGRHWSPADLAGYQAPAGLPEVNAVASTDSVAVLEADERVLAVSVDLVHADGSIVAQLTSAIIDNEALVEEVIHDEDLDPAELASAIATLVAELRSTHPDVSSLAIRELDDDLVRAAAEKAGLEISDRWQVYRLAL